MLGAAFSMPHWADRGAMTGCERRPGLSDDRDAAVRATSGDGQSWHEGQHRGERGAVHQAHAGAAVPVQLVPVEGYVVRRADALIVSRTAGQGAGWVATRWNRCGHCQ